MDAISKSSFFFLYVPWILPSREGSMKTSTNKLGRKYKLDIEIIR